MYLLVICSYFHQLMTNMQQILSLLLHFVVSLRDRARKTSQTHSQSTIIIFEISPVSHELVFITISYFQIYILTVYIIQTYIYEYFLTSASQHYIKYWKLFTRTQSWQKLTENNIYWSRGSNNQQLRQCLMCLKRCVKCRQW